MAQIVMAQNSATPAAPTAGNNTLYFKTDGSLYFEDSSSTEHKLALITDVTSSALSGLTDVTITTPVANQNLSYNGTKWVNTNPSISTVLTISSDFTLTASSGFTQLLSLNGTVAKLAGSNTFTGSQYGSLTTMTFSSPQNLALNTGNFYKLTLTGNTFFNAASGLGVGRFTLFLVQDSTGSRTVTWDSSYKFAGGSAPTLSTVAGKTDIFEIVSDGTNVYVSTVGIGF